MLLINNFLQLLHTWYFQHNFKLIDIARLGARTLGLLSEPQGAFFQRGDLLAIELGLDIADAKAKQLGEVLEACLQGLENIELKLIVEVLARAPIFLHVVLHFEA